MTKRGANPNRSLRREIFLKQNGLNKLTQSNTSVPEIPTGKGKPSIRSSLFRTLKHKDKSSYKGSVKMGDNAGGVIGTHCEIKVGERLASKWVTRQEGRSGAEEDNFDPTMQKGARML